VTLRLYLPIAPLLGFSFEDGYRAISFLSWVPNLIIAEVLLRTWLRTPLVRRARPAPAMA
jgi:hypothetical protein